MGNIEFDQDYYNSEVREGFRIAEMTKRYWAVQLKVIDQIDRVCKNHGLKWYADFGTLLGAVRHSGFIPWDDDMDIVMLRSDYEIFLDAAVKELPDSYVVLDIRLNQDYDDQNGRVVNSHQIGFSREYLEQFCGCPYTAGVDIYLLDSVYDDPELEQDRCERAAKVRTLIGLVANESIDDRKKRLRLISEVESENHVKLPGGNGLLRSLEVLLRKIYSECDSAYTEYVAYMPGWIRTRSAYKYPREWYENPVLKPFEIIEMPVPSEYEEVLRTEYGDYRQIRRGYGATHPYPVYIVQQQILTDHLKKQNNDRMLAYINAVSDKHTEHAARSKEIIGVCSQAMSLIEKVASDDSSSLMALLQSLGNLMDNLSNMIRSDFDERVPAVKLIGRIREDMAEVERQIGNGDQSGIEEGLRSITENISKLSAAVNELYYGHEAIDMGLDE